MDFCDFKKAVHIANNGSYAKCGGPLSMLKTRLFRYQMGAESSDPLSLRAGWTVLYLEASCRISPPVTV